MRRKQEAGPGRSSSGPASFPLFIKCVEVEFSEIRIVWSDRPATPSVVDRSYAAGLGGSVIAVSPIQLAEGWLWGLRDDALPSRCPPQAERSS
jgi:hypothetical protein